MVHIGKVEEEYLGEKKMQNKVRITWELHEEKKVFKEENGEQPFVLSKEFSLSMHEKSSLRKWLESWRGKAFTEDESKLSDSTIAKLVIYLRSRYHLSLSLIDYMSLKLSYCF